MEWVKSLILIKDDIERLYKNNQYMTPYQSFDFLNITGKGMSDKNPLLTLRMNELNGVYRNSNGEAIVVVPLLYQRKNNNCHVWLRGIWTSAGHLDFIYCPDEYTEEVFLDILNEISKRLGKCTFHFSKIQEKSLTAKHIESIFHDNTNKAVEECATICLPDSYDEWFDSLKKSAKQNIRTAYNRMRREELHFEYVFRDKGPMREDEFNEMISLYSKRLAQKNNLSGNDIVAKVLKIAKIINPMTKALKKMQISSYGFIRINNEIAGCFWGVESNDRRLIIPRLSINDKYGVYCPGGILIAETVKELTTKEGKYKEFDLSCGGEPYKYTYGAIKHCNYSYVIELN